MRIEKGLMSRAGLGLAAALAFAMPSVAMAQSSSNAVDDFGVSGRFTYGTGNGATGSFTAAPFYASGCLGQSSFSCYSPTAGGSGVPTVAKNNSGGTVSIGTPEIPNDVLFLHPAQGVGATDAIVRFTAAFSSTYSLTFAFTRLDTVSGTDNGNNGVIASVFQGSNVGNPIFSGVLTSISPYGAAIGTIAPLSVTLAKGETLDFVVNNNGNYNYDSTGLQAVITAVPEASTWALMLVGFGITGGALRRRRKVTGQAALA